MLNFLTSGVVPQGIWTRYGVVFDGDPTADEGAAQEPSVIYESGAQILSGTVFKMWWKGGWTTSHLNYAESADGITWTQYGSNPLLTDTEQPFVFKDGSTYYLYVHTITIGSPFKRYSSSDGLTWNLDNSSVLTVGAGGAWDDYQLGNIFVWKEDTNDWRCLYEARGSSSDRWQLGYATSSDGLSWSKSGSNPVISETGSNGGPFVYKASNGVYWLFGQRSLSGVLPTDINRWYSSDLVTWTRSPARDFFPRQASFEGHASAVGQIADPHLLEINGQVYMWYGAYSDGTQASGASGIALAVSRLSFEKLILHSE